MNNFRSHLYIFPLQLRSNLYWLHPFPSFQCCPALYRSSNVLGFQSSRVPKILYSIHRLSTSKLLACDKMQHTAIYAAKEKKVVQVMRHNLRLKFQRTRTPRLFNCACEGLILSKSISTDNHSHVDRFPEVAGHFHFFNAPGTTNPSCTRVIRIFRLFHSAISNFSSFRTKSQSQF